eukprot:TRINITY_DN28252_c0_g1_i2.p1 TRINITY_DN28252_c0_g1~~TRINITY_DN28252_c0_g1_i2.p1  ORF type:complete len:820 (-),score=155.68 TRINITY_DN28252_c0_g1_i2:148-2607(-)
MFGPFVSLQQLGISQQEWFQWLSELAKQGSAFAGPKACAVESALWSMLAKFTGALGLGADFVVMANRCANLALRLAMRPGASEGAVVARVAALLHTLVERLLAAADNSGALPVQCVSDAFEACTRLFARCPAARNQSMVDSTEAWLRLLLKTAGSEEAGHVCLSILDAAESSGAMPFLNFAWRLLKVLCLDEGCSHTQACTIMHRSIAALGKHICRAMADNSPDAKASRPEHPDEVLAAFHCGNFLRLGRDSPSLKQGDFELKVAFAALAPAVDLLWKAQPRSSSAGCGARHREFVLKAVAVATERWVAAAPALPQASKAEDRHAGLHCLSGQPEAFAGALGATMATLLAANKGLWCSPRAGSALEVALRLVDGGVRQGYLQAGSAPVDALAVLCAANAPGCRALLLTWVTSPEPALYCLAMRIHRSLPKWMGSKRSLDWAKLLVDGLLPIKQVQGQRSNGHGRAHCQVASCMAVLLARCKAGAEGCEWLQDILASGSRRRPPSGSGGGSRADCADPASSPLPGLLLRRMAYAAREAPEGSVLKAILKTSGSAVGRAVLPPNDTLVLGDLRSVAALIRCGHVPGELHRDLFKRLTSVLGRAALPVLFRTAAWSAVAELCLQQADSAGSEFQTALRYAVKHLHECQPAGARVADVLARAPPKLLTGQAPKILEGLCSLEWPLRVGGLSAAASLAAQATEEERATPKSPFEAAGGLQAHAPDALAVATSVLAAFREEYPHLNPGGHDTSRSTAQATRPAWNDSADERLAKRRRLLQELLAEPSEEKDVSCDEQFQRLCSNAQQRIGAWLSHSRPEGRAGQR